MREKILFDNDWIFHKGDIKINAPVEKGLVYMAAKTERKLYGPASIKYSGLPDSFSTDTEMNTEYWENVTLPHDYIIEQVPQKNENCALGFFKYENAWYRKSFVLPIEDREKRITILFEGIATKATVYVNGCILMHNY